MANTGNEPSLSGAHDAVVRAVIVGIDQKADNNFTVSVVTDDQEGRLLYRHPVDNEIGAYAEVARLGGLLEVFASVRYWLKMIGDSGQYFTDRHFGLGPERD